MSKHLCHEVTDADCEVRLYQTGIDRFTVQYGKQVKTGLDYEKACHEYGQCIFHSLACAGKLDNRTRAEAKADGDREPLFNN